MDITSEENNREEFRKILLDLAKSQETLRDAGERARFYVRLENLYYPDKNGIQFRHYYSDIFSLLTQIQSDENLGNIDILGQNLFMIKKGYQSINKDDDGNPIDISNTIKKLYDHVSLDIARITYLSSKEKIMSPEYILNDFEAKVKVISKEEQSLNNKFNEINEKMKGISEKANKLQTDLFTIISIFTAIVITFSFGTNYAGIIFNNIASTNIFRLIFIIVLLGLVMFNIIFALLYFVGKLTGNSLLIQCKNGDCQNCSKKTAGKQSFLCKVENKAPYVLSFNLFLILLIIVDIVIWLLKKYGIILHFK